MITNANSYYIVLGLLGVTLAQNPGFRTVITAKGLSYIDKVGLPILKQQLANVKIPDVSGSTSVSVVGTIDYSLSDIQLSNLKIPTSDIKSSPSGLTVEASSISISGSADWRYKQQGWPHISDSGSADLSVDTVSLSVTAIVEKDAQGHATLRTTGCSFNIGNIAVKFHGGASWLYNLFDDTLASSIKKSLQGQVCNAATQAINDQGNGALESLPVIVKVDSIAEVTYALLSDPIFNNNYIETRHKGEFLATANPVDAPFSPSPLPVISNYDKMMYIWLSEDMANSAGVVYHKAGVLQFTITPEMVPDTVPIRLNTKSFKRIIPSLYKAFPNMDIEVLVNATHPPVLKVVPNSADFTITGNLDVSVIQPNKTKAKAFVLGLTIYTDVHVWVKSNGTKHVSANCTLLKYNLTLVSTSIGNFSIKQLEQYINFLINPLLSLLNLYGNDGLMIPVIDGISFVHPKITLGQGNIMISSNIKYTPIYYGRV